MSSSPPHPNLSPEGRGNRPSQPRGHRLTTLGIFRQRRNTSADHPMLGAFHQLDQWMRVVTSLAGPAARMAAPHSANQMRNLANSKERSPPTWAPSLTEPVAT